MYIRTQRALAVGVSDRYFIEKGVDAYFNKKRFFSNLIDC